MREVDLAARVVRVLARMRGMAAPVAGVAWDDATAAGCSSRDEVEFALDDYSAAFVAIDPALAGGRAAARPAGRRFALGICSNWPLAVTIDRVRRGGRLGRPSERGRRLAAGRRDQAGPADLPGGRGRARDPAGGRSSTSATTGRPMSSARGGPAGGSPGSEAGRATRRCRPASRRRPRARSHPRPADRPGGRALDVALNRSRLTRRMPAADAGHDAGPTARLRRDGSPRPDDQPRPVRAGRARLGPGRASS